VATVAERVLIVNADDFGLSRGINAGVVKAHEQGILTSASLMVRGRASIEAADYARRLPRLSVGLHVDLGEWVFRDGEWHERYRLMATEDYAAARAEARAQLELFRGLLGRDPTHLDSHQHTHTGAPGAEALIEIAIELGVPVRHITQGFRYVGDFYGQSGTGTPLHDAITPDNLAELIRTLPPGITELSCHPAATIDFESVYGEERLVEVKALCDPRMRHLIDEQGIALCSFSELEAFPPVVRDPAKVPGRMDHSGFTLWLTGLPRAGKSTVAGIVAGRLRALGVEQIEVLDGDEVREGLCRDLGFSRADREENIHRITFVSKVLTRNGVVVIVAAISPYREGRERAREEIQSFAEVWCKASVESCAARDYKGLYEKAMRGEITNLTGVNDPYEEPEDADLVLATDGETPEQSAERVMDLLREKNFIP
jgi:chitin disaccharide deacetylase